jgi:diguanylate cyclase (GGDEF)-like protein/PAS domain S-box-containing protein
MDQYNLFATLAPPAALITGVSALYAWRRRVVTGALMLMFDLLCVTGWLLTSSAELLSKNPNMVLASAKLTYLFIASAPVFWVGFAMQYTGKVKWLSFPRFLLFWIIPSLTFMFAQTNEMHGLIWESAEVVFVNENLRFLEVPSYGSWFWVHVIYSYILTFLGAILIARQHFVVAEIYKKQSSWLVVGVIFPLIFNFAYILRLLPGLQKDFSSIAYAFAGIAFSIGVFRHGLLDIMPIARNTIFENMKEGMLVVDREGRLIDINGSARKWLIFEEDTLIGNSIQKYIPEIKPFLPKDDQASRVREISIKRDGNVRNFEGTLTSLYDNRNKHLGYLITLQDITERKRLHEEVKRLASKDPLTNLYNRRHLLERAEQEVQRSSRYKHPISLFIIDLDFFKNINDTYGHLTGDQVLIKFSNFLKETLRNVDIVGRFGGDEFVVVLPETGSATAYKTAMRLCENFKHKSFQTEQEDLSFTLSIGISTENNVGKDTDIYDLIERADRALYRAKALGRNQVAVDSQEYLQ